MYHMFQEITLALAIVLLLFFRSTTVLDTGSMCDAEADPNYQPPSLDKTDCTLVAIVLHYLFAVHFLALFVEVG